MITESEGRGDASIPTMAIVSARGGMTDLLVKVVDQALIDFEQANVALEEAVESAISLLRELAPSEITDPIEARFRNDGQDILSVVQSLRMLNTVPAVTMEVVTGKPFAKKTVNLQGVPSPSRRLLLLFFFVQDLEKSGVRKHCTRTCRLRMFRARGSMPGIF